MKSTTLIFAIVVVALVSVGVIWFSQQSSQSVTSMEKDAPAMKTDSSAKSADNKMMADSRYVQYSSSALENASQGRRVLFFYASWCPTCIPADANFSKEASLIPEDLTVLRVNYNDPQTDQAEKDLAKKYGITYQHTFVQIDSAGEEVTKWNGGQLDELLSTIK